MKQKALISVYNKEGVLDLARFLEGAGWELVSTGGTARYLREAGLPVTDVSALTGFPECLDGRVKTLHPAVHAGILARRDNAAHVATLERLELSRIDLVCVNLYPFFEKAGAALSFDETIEFIDIGGPSMLRSAAKNADSVLVLTRPQDYAAAIADIQSGVPQLQLRRRLAAQVFNLTSAYDAAISRYLFSQIQTEEAGGTTGLPDGDFPPYWAAPLERVKTLRYGENGHQKAALYRAVDSPGALHSLEELGGKELSYNNLRDLDLAWKAVCSFGLPAAGVSPLGAAELRALLPAYRDEPAATCVAVKHNTPCGIGQAAGAHEAFLKARAGDPVSIFGGIVAFNTCVDAEAAASLCELFLEIVAAPAFTSDALELLRRKKSMRIVRMDSAPRDHFEAISVDGGVLVQETNRRLFERWEQVSEAAPSAELIPDLVFGMRAVTWLKSNAIAVVQNGALWGAGGGETNRIWAAGLALERAGRAASHGERAAVLGGGQPAVLASDAFFPFADVVELAAANGIRAIIQCGGSANDQLSIDACNAHGIAMIFTGIRCFKH